MAASPPTEPVTLMVPPASAALTTSSAVILSTEIVAVAAVSTVKGRLLVAVNGLPASSLPVRVAVTLPAVSAATSVAGTVTLKVMLSALTVAA